MSEREPLDVVAEYAAQAVEYVRRALDFELGYDSDTLPALDHYLRSLSAAGDGEDPTPPDLADPVVTLVTVASGAYFGEVIRRRLGGRWQAHGEPESWRLVLPTGLSFAPVGFAAAAIVRDDEGIDAAFDCTRRMRPYLESVLERMNPVSEEVYYSLCGRLDTLEHVEEALRAIAIHEARLRDTDETVH